MLFLIMDNYVTVTTTVNTNIADSFNDENLIFAKMLN